MIIMTMMIKKKTMVQIIMIPVILVIMAGIATNLTAFMQFH